MLDGGSCSAAAWRCSRSAWPAPRAGRGAARRESRNPLARRASGCRRACRGRRRPPEREATRSICKGERAMSEGTTKRLTLVACILGSGIALLDSTVVNVALPSIQRDLGGGLAAQQWVVNAYLLTLGSLILIGGSLGDLFGERRIF